MHANHSSQPLNMKVWLNSRLISWTLNPQDTCASLRKAPCCRQTADRLALCHKSVAPLSFLSGEKKKEQNKKKEKKNVRLLTEPDFTTWRLRLSLLFPLCLWKGTKKVSNPSLKNFFFFPPPSYIYFAIAPWRVAQKESDTGVFASASVCLSVLLTSQLQSSIAPSAALLWSLRLHKK